MSAGDAASVLSKALAKKKASVGLAAERARARMLAGAEGARLKAALAASRACCNCLASVSWIDLAAREADRVERAFERASASLQRVEVEHPPLYHRLGLAR